MPESIVQLPADSTGKKLHTFERTIGANVVQDEVVLLGEQYLASYIVPSEFAAVSTLAVANDHLLQIMAGASLKVRVRRIEVLQYAQVTAAALMLLRLHRLITAGTGGTAGQVNGLDPADGAAGATVMVRPTVKGTEGGYIASGLPVLIQTAATSSINGLPVWVWDFDRPRSKPLIIAAGTANGFAIKNINTQAAGSLVFNVWLDESNF